MSEWGRCSHDRVGGFNCEGCGTLIEPDLDDLKSEIITLNYRLERLRSREAKLLSVVGKLKQHITQIKIYSGCEEEIEMECNTALASVSAEMEIEG